MAGPNKKRPIDGRLQRPSKKQKRKQAYHSESEEDSFDPVNLLDSDDENIHNAMVDDGQQEDAGSSSSEDDRPAPKKKMTLKADVKSTKKAPETQPEESSGEEEEEASSNDEMDDDEEEGNIQRPNQRSSKKHDNTAFATSLSKILSTKLATSKRSDPVLSRSIDAKEASRAMLDNALESKARKQMREQKRRAFEKGRVKDVLLATRNEDTGELETSTSEIMVTERRLRKVAQRGVVKLFNAVRAAQVAAVEAEKGTKKAGMIGMDSRGEKVNELTKKGFLDLIASGGGGLKKGGLEEA